MSISLLDQWRLAQAIIADPALGAPAARVAVALLGFQNRLTGRCDPALASIGEAAGMKRSATWAAITALEKAGWITATGHGGRSKGNAYSFAYDRLKPAGKPDGKGDETCRASGPYERINRPEKRTKPSGNPDPNPKVEPSLVYTKEKGSAQKRVPNPSSGGLRPRGFRPQKVDPVRAMLDAGARWDRD